MFTASTRFNSARRVASKAAGLAAACLLGSAVGAHAQTAAPAPTPPPPAAATPWYAGAQAGLEGRPFVLDRKTNQGQTTYGGFLPAATVYGGYRLAPKAALQLGITHGSGLLNDGHKLTMWNVPLQLRKQISEPERRFQAGAFAEASACFAQRKAFQAPDAGYSLPALKAVNYFLGVGFSTSFALTNQLDFNADLPVHFNLQMQNYFGPAVGFSPMAGLRYRF